MEKLAAATKQVLQSGMGVSELRSKVFDYDKRTSSSYVGYFDMMEMMEYLTDDAGYQAWKQAFASALGYWNTTEKNFSMFVGRKFDSIEGMFPMQPRANGVTHYIPSESTAYEVRAANIAYRSTAWYEAAGLSLLGW